MPVSNAESNLKEQNKRAYLFMVMGMFMAVLDIQIVASSINEVQAALGASADEISWVQTSYLVAEVIMIPICGWLARVFSTRILFCFCGLIFTLASALCALAWNLEAMIFFRVIQGFFGGALIPTVFASIFFIFEPHERSKAMIMAGVVTTMAPTLGPTVGGWLTTYMSWHWMFLVNVIPGIIMCTNVWKRLDIDKPNYALLRKIDYVGFALLAVGLGTLEVFLKKGQKYDWFDSGFVTFLFMIVASCLVGMVVYELKRKDPIVNVRAFANRNFTIGCISSFATGVGLYGSVYLFPLLLGIVRGYNSLQIGQVMFATGLFMFASGPLAGVIEKKIDLRLMLAIGLGLFGLGLIVNGQLTSDVGFYELLLPQVIRGISIMFCFLPLTQVSLGLLPKEDIPNASGLYNLTRNLGGAIGIAIIDTLLRNRITYHTQALKSMISPGRENLLNFEGMVNYFSAFSIDPHVQELLANKVMFGRLLKQAYVLAFNDVFTGLGLYLWACLLFIPFLKHVKHAGDASAGGH